MLTSTGNINQEYEVVGAIHAMISLPEQKGCSGNGLPILDAYVRVTEELESIARGRNADAVINIGYEQRVSASQGCGGQTSSHIELYGWGTAVALKR